MEYTAKYQEWLEKADTDTVAELKGITNQSEIEDRFYRDLEFGTGGLRGVMGAGTNRMNRYMVGKATQGLCEYIKEQGVEAIRRGVVIAYDSRNNSRVFAKHTANVLIANGINTYIYENLRPTPMLSFAVRHLHAFAGVVITASHNPAEYNGYKVYFEDGGQLPPSVSDKIIQYIDRADTFSVPEEMPAELPEGVALHEIGEEVDVAYLENVKAQAIHKDLDKKGYKLVYTPLHGSGNIPVRRILAMTGFEDVITVPEQTEPDGDFPTVKSPNPENHECFALAIELAKKNDCDLIIGTDPDSDRVGIVVKNSDGDYVTMTGNQVGALLTDYVLAQRKANGTLPKDAAVVSTIVTSGMIEAICKKYGVTYFATLTGFKFIGEKIHEFEQNHRHTFVLGLEESYGYLAGTYARDKDAVVASMLIAEMAVFYSKQGKTLYDVMQELYKTYGYFMEETVSVTLKGKDGAEKIQALMKSFRDQLPTAFGGYPIARVNDYLLSKGYMGGKEEALTLPKSNVLQFLFDNGSGFVIRPSGTEPKIKLYYLICEDSREHAKKMMDAVKEDIGKIIQ